VPLPTNEPGPVGIVESLDDIAGVELRRESSSAETSPRSAPQTVQEPHPVLERAGTRPRENRSLRAAVLADWRLDTVFGYAISPDGHVLGESAWGHEQLVSSGIISARRLPHPRSLAGTHAALISQWCEHYYHWLADALPRFLVLERLGFGHLPLLVPPRTSAYQRDSLTLLGANEHQLVAAPADLVQPDTLVWPAFAGPSGHPPVWACREIGDRLRAAAGVGDRAPGFRRLFISRSRAAHRRIVNEDELVEALRPYGFEVVAPETLTLREQVLLFADAEIVVAPHGAGLANLLFARDASVVEIHEPDNINTCFYNLIEAVGHDYWYVLGDRFGGHAVGPSYRDILAPVAVVDSTVAEIISTRMTS
jgi:hypothetical protein